MGTFTSKEQIRNLVNEYYNILKKALDFQRNGNISDYTRSLIRAQQIEEQLRFVY